jgi:cell division protein FtsQ
MDLSARKKYSFPVIIGMGLSEPLSTRAARMRIYNGLIRDLDSGGGHYSKDLSEVDLSDPEDVKVLTNDADGEVLIHLGSANYLDRFKVYVAHLREWRQQFAKVESVDLRYEHQIIVNPDLRRTIHQPALSAAAAKTAISAGVKPAALITREPRHTPPQAITFKKVSISTPRVQKEGKAAWHKPKNQIKKASLKAANAPVVVKTHATPPQKPSPAILKQQEAR